MILFGSHIISSSKGFSRTLIPNHKTESKEIKGKAKF